MADQKTTDELLEAKLRRLLICAPYASEHEKLKKELKPVFEGHETTIVGDFEVTGNYVKQPEKHIPAVKYWNMKVRPIIKENQSPE